jgi:hypothetical protein
MSRSRHRYSLSRRAAKLPEIAGAPIFIDRLTDAGKRLVAGRQSLKRHALAEPDAIERHMAIDLAEIAAAGGAVTEDDLERVGWTRRQIAAYQRRAIERAHVEDVREARP